MKRSCPSDSSVTRRKVSRQTRGASNGSSLEHQHQRARRPGTIPAQRIPRVACVTSTAAGRRPAAARLLQVLEEFRARVEHHHVALVLERRLVRFEAAIERVELGVLPERRGVDRRRLGVAFALDLLRLPVGFGEDDLALAIGVGADLLRLGAALRAQLVGDALALRFHALVDLRQHFVGQLDAPQAHVDDLDADRARVGVDLLPRLGHDLVALGRDHLVDGALVDLLRADWRGSSAPGGASRLPRRR